MVTAVHMSELVLVAEVLIPVRAKKKVVCLRAGPPRALEVAVEQGIPADENGSRGNSARLDFGLVPTARGSGNSSRDRGVSEMNGVRFGLCRICSHSRIGGRSLPVRERRSAKRGKAQEEQ